ncbi:MAG: ribonucleotide-diphosphate reductase subunit beta, partial [Burkholderiaceae bacterium]
MLNWEDTTTTTIAPKAPPSVTEPLSRGPVPSSIPDADLERRVRVEDKRVINGGTDVNQLVP